jgi:hypothetical protein
MFINRQRSSKVWSELWSTQYENAPLTVRLTHCQNGVSSELIWVERGLGIRHSSSYKNKRFKYKRQAENQPIKMGVLLAFYLYYFWCNSDI